MSHKALIGLVLTMCLLSVPTWAVPLDLSGTLGAKVKYTPLGLWEPKMTLSLNAGFTTGVDQHARLTFSLPVWPSGEKWFTDPTYSPLNLHLAETTLILQGSLLSGMPRTKMSLGALSINYGDYIGRPVVDGWANPQGISIEGLTFTLGGAQRFLTDLPRLDTFFAFGTSTTEFLYGARLQLQGADFSLMPVWTGRSSVPTRLQPSGRTILDWQGAETESDLGLELSAARGRWTLTSAAHIQRNASGDPGSRIRTQATAVKADLVTSIPDTGIDLEIGYRNFEPNFRPVFRAPESERKPVTELRGQSGYSIVAKTELVGTDVTYSFDRYNDRLSDDRSVTEQGAEFSRPIRDAAVTFSVRNVDDSTQEYAPTYIDLSIERSVSRELTERLGFSSLTGKYTLSTDDELGRNIALTIRFDGSLAERLPGADTYFGIKYVTNTAIGHSPLAPGTVTPTVPQLYVMAGLEHTLPNGLGIKARWATPTVKNEPMPDANLFEISASVSF